MPQHVGFKHLIGKLLCLPQSKDRTVSVWPSGSWLSLMESEETLPHYLLSS